MFEHISEPLISRRAFFHRFAASTVVGLILIVISLMIGILGYHLLEKLSWADSFLNASMLLGGEGPLDHQRTPGGKIFEGFYALFSGIAVLSISGVIFAPVVHRFLHKMHVKADPSKKTKNR